MGKLKSLDKQYVHVFNSGVERRVLFNSQQDFDRFEGYLYLLNAVDADRAANYFVRGREGSIFESARGEQLVAIGAYSFIPHDFHLLLTPLVHGGVGKFMQRLQTAYTMYFNRKYQHEGRLFRSSYLSEDIQSDEHLKSVFSYIHLHPAQLFDHAWEEKGIDNLLLLSYKALQYRYSSANERRTGKKVITNLSAYPKGFFKINSPEDFSDQWLKYRSHFSKK